MAIEWSVHKIESCPSTNSEMVQGYKAGRFKVGDVLVSKIQTAGKGRLDRQWTSPLGNLAFSCLVPAPLIEGKSPQISLVAGLALARSLEAFSTKIQIKWPNDIFLGGKKVAGILSEAEGKGIIVGIGINWNSTRNNFPAELQSTLTTIADETGEQQDEAHFFEIFLSHFAKELALYAESGLSDMLKDIDCRLAYKNQVVTIRDGEKTYAATVIGITKYGYLQVKAMDGESHILVSADVIPPGNQ